MECLLPYLCMVTVPHIMVGLERMLDYRGVGLARFHCMVFICMVQESYNYNDSQVDLYIISGLWARLYITCSIIQSDITYPHLRLLVPSPSASFPV